MTGPSFFTASRITGRHPSPRSWFIAGRTANGITSTGTMPLNAGTIFASSTTTINLEGCGSNAFLPGVGCPASLDHAELRVDLIGAVNRDIDHRVIVERGERDPVLPRPDCGLVRCGNSQHREFVIP